LRFSVLAFVVLIATVCAITLHSAFLIERLDKQPSVWPPEKLRKLGLNNNRALRQLRKTLEQQGSYYLDEWLDIKFIATYSKVAGKLVYYPFIILALMIFARSKFFDNWDAPIGLIIIFSITAILTLGSAFYLRYVAEKTRKTVIKNITNMKVFLTAQSKSTAHDVMEKQIDIALIQIQEINEGAFQSLTRDPAVQAILIPFGGVGGVMLLENLLLGF
jgi:hypothetical protein